MGRGSSSRSGPAADPNALRRDRDKGEWTILPIEGRGDEPAPEWPLSPANEREAHFWDLHWRKPQAVMWERFGQEIEVATYCRTLAQAEKHDAAVAIRTLLKQQMEQLGISVPGLRANRWIIPRDEVKTRRAERAEEIAEPRTSTRDRLKALAGGAG